MYSCRYRDRFNAQALRCCVRLETASTETIYVCKYHIFICIHIGVCSIEKEVTDDLYPLLPVLLPTRDNTNHYHRLITGITANIEIMCVPPLLSPSISGLCHHHLVWLLALASRRISLFLTSPLFFIFLFLTSV